MAAGGLLLEPLSDADRAQLNIAEESMALFVKHVGQYGPHAAAKKAGFRQGDVLVEYDGRSDLMREADVLVHGVTERRVGDKVSATVLRDGKKMKLMLPMQP
jgi:S1-C subfamily serine protease